MSISLEQEKIKKIDSLLSSINMDGRNIVFEHEVYEILDILGIKVPAYHYITKPEQVTDDILSKFGYWPER